MFQETVLIASTLRGELQRLGLSVRQVWRIVPRQRKWALATAALIMSLTSAGNTAIALLLGWLIDQVQSGVEQNWTKDEFYRSAAIALGGLAAIYVTREILHVVRRYLVENSCTRINRDMQTRLVSHILKSDLSELSKEKVGAVQGKIFRSVDGLVRFIRLMFLDCFPALLTGVFAIAAAVTKNPFLGSVMLGVIPISMWLTIRQLRTQRDIRLELMRDCECVDGTVVEQLGGAEYIRVANTVPAEVQRLFTVTERRRRREIKHHLEMSLFGCAKALNEGFFHVVVLAATVVLAVNGELSFGDILTFSVLFLNVMTPLNEVHRVLDEGHEASLRVADLLEMLQKPDDPSFNVRRICSIDLQSSNNAIELEHVSVEYLTPEGDLKTALEDISLCIKRGETIGVAGPSGSGKSTWIRALLRLIHPSQGHIRIGGMPISDIGRCDIAQLVGYVGQIPFVYSGTVRENICYGNKDVPDEDIWRAAQHANLHEELLALPHGYDTRITERGQNLSGGQRQRLAIARILLRCPPILILDEATSALDNISERFIQRSLGVKNCERTTIIIAHRLSTLKDCDRIFVFDEGRIVEVGGYDELILNNGLFAALITSAENGIGTQSETNR